MKAIETEYRRHRFRSRLEARWAVFFDWCGIRWQYEPEGYVLSDGARYLPDFFLPGFTGERGLYVEVKRLDGDISKAIKFGTEAAPILILDGPPAVRLYDIYAPEMNGEPCPSCFSSKYLEGGKNASEYRMWTGASLDDARYWHNEGMVTDAIDEAVRARFEFGDRPLMDSYGTHPNN